VQSFKFRNLRTAEDRTVKAPGMLEALNQISRIWFSGTPVVDWVPNGSGQINLLSADRDGSVVGTVFFWG
jgi:hypothetical protein